MEQICDKAICSVRKYFCSCKGESVLLCEAHMKSHKELCFEKIKQVCQLWTETLEATACYISLHTTIGEAKLGIQKLIHTKDCIEAISRGKNLKNEKNCEDFTGILTFIPNLMLKKKRKIHISIENITVDKVFKLSATLDDIKSIVSLQLPGLFIIENDIESMSLFCEFTEDSLSLKLRVYKEAIIIAFSYIKQSFIANPFDFLVFLPELKQNSILCRVFKKAQALHNTDLAILAEYEKIFLIDCLITPDYKLNHTLKRFREALVDSLFRPFNFREIISISGLSPEQAFVTKMKNYIDQLLSNVYVAIGSGFGVLSPFILSKDVSLLAKSILLSKPSVKIILLMHSDVFKSREEVEEFVKSALASWEKGKRIYFWEKAVSRSEVFTALSGKHKRVYVSSSFVNLTVLGKALVITHEMQHLFQRKRSLLYSPSLFIRIPEIRKFYEEKNSGIPLEAGHLHLALLTGTIDSEVNQMIHFSEGNAANPEFWTLLNENYPIFPQVKHVIEENNYRNLPFSLDFEPCYPFLF